MNSQEIKKLFEENTSDVTRTLAISDLIEQHPELTGPVIMMLIERTKAETQAQVANDFLSKAQALVRNAERKL